MIVKLKGYLATLEDEERLKPLHQRRSIPTVTELAQEVGVSRAQMQRVVGGHIDSLKLKVGSGIIQAMRQRGFPMQVTDLIDYRD